MPVSETTCTLTTIRRREHPATATVLEIVIPFARVPETADSAFIGAGSWLIPGIPNPEPGHIPPPWQGQCAGARPWSF